MSDKQSILLKAGQHALAVDSSRTGVEEARLAVERAKAELESAKADHENAKAAFEGALDECEAAGIPKARARKAIEALNQAWIEAGIVEAAVTSEQPSADDAEKGPRKKRRSKAEIEAAKAAEDAGEASPAETAAAVLQEPAGAVFSAEIDEIEFIIDENLVPVDTSSAEAYETARTLLKALVHAAAWSAAQANSAEFDLETFRSVLDSSSAYVLASSAGLPSEQASALAAALASDGSGRTLSWFKDVLSNIEDGCRDGVEPLYVQASAPAEAAAVEAETPDVEMLNEIAVSTSGDQTVQSQDDFGSSDDEILPDYDEVLDDDRSFPLDGTAEDYADDGETVSDIGEINFLEETEEAAEEPAPAETAPAPVETAPVEKPKPPRTGFAPPSFLKSK